MCKKTNKFFYKCFIDKQYFCIVTENIDLNENNPLLSVDTPIVSHEECKKLYNGHLDPIEDIEIGNVCTGGKANALQNASTCRLLPGGPVACYDQKSYQWTMIAINSNTYTTNCATKTLPDVNMALDAFLIKWLHDVLRIHSKN